MPIKLSGFKYNLLRVLTKYPDGLSEEAARQALAGSYGRQELPLDQAALELHEEGFLTLASDKILVLSDGGRSTVQEAAHRKEAGRLARSKKRLRIKAGLVTRELHEALKAKVAELGHMLGMNWEMEKGLVEGGNVRLDIVWFSDASRSISHAFEVQNRGDWKNAIGNLEAVRRYFPECKLFLVVSQEKEIETILKLLGEKMDDSIRVIPGDNPEKWHDILRKVPPRVSSSIQEMRTEGLL